MLNAKWIGRTFPQAILQKGVDFCICQRQSNTDQIYSPTCYNQVPEEIHEITIFKTLDIWQRRKVSFNGQETSEATPYDCSSILPDKVSWIQCRKGVGGDIGRSWHPELKRRSRESGKTKAVRVYRTVLERRELHREKESWKSAEDFP